MNNSVAGIKSVLLSWQGQTLPEGVPRVFDYGLLKDPSILTIVGPRRAGKTYLCYQIIRHLKAKGVPQQNLVFINAEDERLYPLHGDELTQLWDSYQELLSPDAHQTIFFIIDEVQAFAHWSLWARRMQEQQKGRVKLILTGSSSKLLSRELATELRGRSLSVEIFPLSFGEWVRFKKLDPAPRPAVLHSPQKNQYKKIFNLFFKDGGFPELTQSAYKETLLQVYYKTMFARDLIERFRIRQIPLFEDYLKLQLDQFSCRSTLTGLEGKLKILNHQFSKNTLSKYYRAALDIYLIFELEAFSAKLKNRLKLARKVYVIDQGLIQAIRFSVSEDDGRILENIIFLHLRRTRPALFFYNGKRECDFLVFEKNRCVEAIQVCWSLQNPDTRDREIEGLIEAMDAFSVSHGTIVTENEYEDLMIQKRKIAVRPAWYYLLQRQIVT